MTDGELLSKIVWSAQHDREFDYAFWLSTVIIRIGEAVSRNLTCVLVGAGMSVTVLLGCMGIQLVLPALHGTTEGWPIRLHVVWALFLLGNILFNYFMAVVTPPGTVTDETVKAYQAQQAKNVSDLERQPPPPRSPSSSAPSPSSSSSSSLPSSSLAPALESPVYLDTCKHCDLVRPPRTHHCSVCNKCVLKMDHHCPWIANCAGYGNYRYFVTFLVWTTIGTAYLAVLCFYVAHRDTTVLSEFRDAMTDWMWNVVATTVKCFDFPFNLKDGPDGEKSLFELFTGPTGSEGDAMDNRGAVAVAAASQGLEDHTTHAFTRLGRSSLPLVFNGPDYVWWPLMQAAGVAWWINAEHIILVTMLVSIGVFMPVCGLCVFHLMLITVGETTVEHMINANARRKCKREGRRFRNPFDRGSLSNIGQVFGHDVPLWRALLPSMRPPPPILPPLDVDVGR